MARLTATIIDVGWGDSILLETESANGDRLFGLIDCNDTKNERTAYSFVKRHLELAGIAHDRIDQNFRFVLLTHGHADHHQGLKWMLEKFGTNHFWYPKSIERGSIPYYLRYARRSRKRVGKWLAINRDSELIDLATGSSLFGDVKLSVLWPRYDSVDESNENLNSVVLAATLGDVAFVFTGDAEASVWPQIVDRIPAATKVFQLPHHGAENGLFSGGATPWLDALDAAEVRLVMSSHIRPHSHPAPSVVSRLDTEGFRYLRTDEHYHVTFETDGDDARGPTYRYTMTE
jgi:beta-lactamase superfamily II metal-dependent hydrolase